MPPALMLVSCFVDFQQALQLCISNNDYDYGHWSKEQNEEAPEYEARV
jgi:hypothetical protein